MLGCYNKDLNFKIRFAQTEGLRADDRIIFEKNHIGKVDAISYSEGGDYIADVKIDKGFIKAVTEHSRFFIINDPSEKGRKAIEMIKVAEGGVPLEKGAMIEGSTRFAFLLGQKELREKIQKELLPWIQKEIENLKERLRKFGREKEVEPLEVKMEEIRKI